MKRRYVAALLGPATAVVLALVWLAATSAAAGGGAAGIRVPLKPVNGYHQSGVALLTPTKNGFTVKLAVTSGPAADGGHAHIHKVTCARYARIAPRPHAPTADQIGKQLGTVVVYLNDLSKRKSVTDAPGSLAKYLRGGYSINVHIPNDPYTAVMCGDIPRHGQ
jgi:hypothetical protein